MGLRADIKAQLARAQETREAIDSDSFTISGVTGTFTGVLSLIPSGPLMEGGYVDMHAGEVIANAAQFSGDVTTYAKKTITLNSKTYHIDAVSRIDGDDIAYHFMIRAL
jgi:hypothetical protein